MSQQSNDTIHTTVVYYVMPDYTAYRDECHDADQVNADINKPLIHWISDNSHKFGKRTVSADKIVSRLNSQYNTAKESKKIYEQSKQKTPASQQETSSSSTYGNYEQAIRVLSDLYTNIEDQFEQQFYDCIDEDSSDYPNEAFHDCQDPLTEIKTHLKTMTKKQVSTIFTVSLNYFIDDLVDYICNKDSHVKSDKLHAKLHFFYKIFGYANYSHGLHQEIINRIMLAKAHNPHQLSEKVYNLLPDLPGKPEKNELDGLFKSKTTTANKQKPDLREVRTQLENLQRDVIATDIKLDDNGIFELHEDWISCIDTIKELVSQMPLDKTKQLSRLSDDRIRDIVDFSLVKESDISCNQLSVVLGIFHYVFGNITPKSEPFSLYEQELIRAIAEIRRFPKKNTDTIRKLDDALAQFCTILGNTIEKQRLITLGEHTRPLPNNNNLAKFFENKYGKNKTKNKRKP